MQWQKLGLIFCPDNHREWMVSHAANPIARQLHDSIYRIYFSCRDKSNRSHVGYVDIDLKQPQKILAIAEHPVLAPGEIGTFDDSGISLGCIISRDDCDWLYYVGWNLAVTVPWRNSIGLALFNDSDSKTCQRYSPAPIFDRNRYDPFSMSYPWVMYDQGRWRMWYGSNLSWGHDKSSMQHVIKHAESADGIHWQANETVTIPLLPGEVGISKPCVIKEHEKYKMWYAFRDQTYRIGYAESTTGYDWQRMDNDVGINPATTTAWDDREVAYPFVFDHDGERYLLYCGNGYGKTGFGLARLETAV